ncbi:MAG TPA: aminoacyl-tRNA hydrolase [Sphingomonadales bacterium]
MFIFVGLGNPGSRYANNRHNIGFMAVDEIVRRHGFSPWREKFSGLAAEGRLGDHKVVALKPQTFMNRSGQSVGEALRFYKLDVRRLVVFYDELDLAPGKLRVKRGGGAGGHNGIRDIDQHVGNDYLRVRLGIGHPGAKELVTPYVLGDFFKAELEWRDALLAAVAEEAPKLLEDDTGARFTSAVALRYRPPAAPEKGAPQTPQ